ncbi:MAG: tetratricopeptide repeat protein [Lachnospiraceae bacterium]|nr:tetratricopeptide repeat protein [Lachnospiraceae bacterium]
MKCFVCGSRIGREDICMSCGTDIRTYRHIMCMSNKLYNDGLAKANVRDISGAIIALNESLKYNKKNIDARNLLGLCYFERGEVVPALSEWIISKNYESKKNVADEYIDYLQSNPARLDTINQTIKKYNQALNYCYQNSQDLAIVQLKKVLSINANLIAGYQLLALLYIETKEYEKARRTLLHAIRIDRNDITTQRYLKEINNLISEQSADGDNNGNPALLPQDIITYQNGNDTIIQPVGAKEKRGFSSIINIAIGLVIGIAISWYLILPGKVDLAIREENDKFMAVSEELTAEKASHQESVKQAETLKAQNDELNRQVEELTGTRGAVTENDKLLKAALLYLEDPANSGEAMEELAGIGNEYLEDASESFKDLYGKIQEVSADSALKDYIDVAKEALKTKDYKTAIEYYSKVCDLAPDNSDYLMDLAYAYRESEDKAKADEIYNRVMEEFPGTENASEAAQMLGMAPAPETTEQTNEE